MNGRTVSTRRGTRADAEIEAIVQILDEQGWEHYFDAGGETWGLLRLYRGDSRISIAITRGNEVVLMDASKMKGCDCCYDPFADIEEVMSSV